MLQPVFLDLRRWRCVSVGLIDLGPFLCLCVCVQHLSTAADVQTVKRECSNEVEKIICEEKDNDRQVIKPSSVKTTAISFFKLVQDSLDPLSSYRQVLLRIEEKLFVYLHHAVFQENNGGEVRTLNSHLLRRATSQLQRTPSLKPTLHPAAKQLSGMSSQISD